MTRLPRPCLGARDPATRVFEPCGLPTVGQGKGKVARCDKHAAWYEATRRPSPSRRGYDREYRRDRAELGLETGQVRCELRLPGCTGWADTADHSTPVSLGGRRSRLVPACKHCNSARGNRDAPAPAVVEDDAWFPPP